MAAAISNEIVRIYAHYQERGPSRAKTYVFDDVVLTEAPGRSNRPSPKQATRSSSRTSVRASRA